MLLVAAAALCALGGCASTPEASPERDADAKLFGSQPAHATLYVYRPDTTASSEDDSLLIFDGKLIGATLPQTFFRIVAEPGTHVFSGVAVDNGRLQLEGRPGEIYFIRLRVAGGQSFFEPVNPGQGRSELLGCCALLENWRPGQRPLLR